MAISYTDNPANISEIIPYVIVEKGKIASKIYEKNRCYFYDTCSFRRHSNLDGSQAEYIFRYINVKIKIRINTYYTIRFRVYILRRLYEIRHTR